MFNINLDDIKAIAGESCNTVAYPTVSKEQLQELFVCEALQYMSRRDLAPDAKNQAIYNKEVAATLREDVSTAPQYIVELFKKQVGAVQAANLSGDNNLFCGCECQIIYGGHRHRLCDMQLCVRVRDGGGCGGNAANSTPRSNSSPGNAGLRSTSRSVNMPMRCGPRSVSTRSRASRPYPR